MNKLVNYQLNYWPGHEFGSCQVNHEHRLVYVNIPKNATEWTKQYFPGESANFITDTWDQGKNYRYLVPIRNPENRWYSGVIEYFDRYSGIRYDPNFLNNLDVIKLLLTMGPTDEHTELQFMFIKELDLTRTTFFWCDEKYSADITQYLKDRNIEPGSNAGTKPTHVSSGRKLESIKQLKQNINKYSMFRRKLLGKLYLDFQFIKSVQFYNIEGNPLGDS